MNGARQTTDPASVATATAPQTWKLVVAYDGTDFHGWQVQPGVRTVQGELAQAVQAVTGERVLPQGSGRTDRGVHAEGQAVSLVLTAPIPPERLLRALNRKLPSAVRVVHAERVHAEFHARAAVLEKTYEYRLFARRGWTAPEASDERILSPWQARYAWDCRYPLLLDRMQEAAGDVVGTFDFTSFAAFDPDRTTRLKKSEDHRRDANTSNVRSVFASTWMERDGFLLYRVSGSGFLYHMVRNLVGTFVEIGCGRRDAASIPALIAARNRALAGPTAPPQGLFLMDVVYGGATALGQNENARQPEGCR